MYEKDIAQIQNKDIRQGSPRYEKIALDIAYSIYHGILKEGERVKGRSTLAGKYNVSPETIRRAIKLLSDMEVVEVIPKSGIFIRSKENASQFIQEYQSKNEFLYLIEDLERLNEEKQNIEKKIRKQLSLIIEHKMQLRNAGIIYPFEVEIHSTSPLIGKTLESVRFWQKTAATVLGINRKGKLMLSPGPDIVFEEGDVILFIGRDEDVCKRVNEFVKNAWQK